MQQQIALQKIEPYHGHCYLSSSDECYYFGTYTPPGHYNYSQMNQLICNFKKPMSHQGKKDWPYKEIAIGEVTNYIQFDNHWASLCELTWIPIPPSKQVNSINHDNRLVRVLTNLKNTHNSFDFREVFLCGRDRESAKASNMRPTIDELKTNWIFRKDLVNSLHEPVVIFDDLITEGASFKAAQQLLLSQQPNLKIIGLFIARTEFVNNQTLV